MVMGFREVAITVQCLLDREEKENNQSNKSLPSISIAPSVLRNCKPCCFKPRVVSIGPLHIREENVEASEKLKVKCMFDLLSRLDPPKKKTLDICVQKVNDSIDIIRSCYVTTISYNNRELEEIMVLDACFILEFLYISFKNEKPKWLNLVLVNSIIYDLVLLENQIPFFVLENIFKCTISKFDETVTLVELIYPVLKHVNLFQDQTLFDKSDVPVIELTNPHHILDLLHRFYQKQDAKSSEIPRSNIHSAVELDRAGVNFKPMRGETEWPMKMEVKSCTRLPYLSCSWGKPTLIMPILHINDSTELVLRNLIAYEQCTVDVRQYVTSYTHAMDMLIDSQDDINMLVESKVIVNQIGSDQEAADMINSICKEVIGMDFFYGEQWKELDRHYNGYWPRNIAWLRRTYFNNPWNIIALLAGIVLFVLTVIQTVYAVNPAGTG